MGQKRQMQVPSHACVCHGEAHGVEAVAPDPGTMEEGAIQEIVQVGKQIEELENQEGDDVQREKEVLASVEAELIQAALPPGCNLECFFDNHQWLPDHGEHTEEAILDHFQQNNRKFEAHACDCHGEQAVIGEIVHVKEEIEELESQDSDSAKLKKEVLESVEEGLVESVFPSDCDLDCFFDNNPWLKKMIIHTEDAVLNFFQNKGIPTSFCACRERDPAGEDSAPDAGAMKEILHVQEEINTLEHQEGESAKLKKEVLASVQEELIEVALPPGCNLDCFFEKESWLDIEHTEEAVLDFFKEQNVQMPSHACDCLDETVNTAAMAEAGS